MHSAANSRKSVGAFKPSNVGPLFSFCIPSASASWKLPPQYPERYRHGLIIQANGLLVADTMSRYAAELCLADEINKLSRLNGTSGDPLVQLWRCHRAQDCPLLRGGETYNREQRTGGTARHVKRARRSHTHFSKMTKLRPVRKGRRWRVQITAPNAVSWFTSVPWEGAWRGPSLRKNLIDASRRLNKSALSLQVRASRRDPIALGIENRDPITVVAFVVKCKLVSVIAMCAGCHCDAHEKTARPLPPWIPAVFYLASRPPGRARWGYHISERKLCCVKVISRHGKKSWPCPLYPRKRTLHRTNHFLSLRRWNPDIRKNDRGARLALGGPVPRSLFGE